MLLCNVDSWGFFLAKKIPIKVFRNSLAFIYNCTPLLCTVFETEKLRIPNPSGIYFENDVIPVIHISKSKTSL